MDKVVLIMAGGSGTRFWPLSTNERPKQFLDLVSEKTMIRETVDRVVKLIPAEKIFISTNIAYLDIIKKELPEIPEKNIIFEPMARDTAACIGYAALIIQKIYKDSIMAVLPSDHLIKKEKEFLESLNFAFEEAEKDVIVTLGIKPSYPETGYGYINFKRGDSLPNIKNVYEVLKFEEKPNIEKAKEYLASGQYLWNSGMFIWKASTILKCFKEFLPEIYSGLQVIATSIGTNDYEKVLKEEFVKLPSESIDYGVMEKAENIYVIPGNFGWDDVGSWLSIERIKKSNQDGNVINGNVISIKTKNTVVQGGKKLIATIGLEDMIIVDTEDAILICNKDNTQEVKEVINNLKICNRTEYL